MNLVNKIRKRKVNTDSNNSLLQQYIEDYKLYFETMVNKCTYENKYDNTIKGECIILDVSSFNPDKDGDEKYITTLPNSNIKVGMILKLGFANDYTEYWVVTMQEHLAIPSHDKFKINPLYHFGKLVKSDGTELPFDCKMEVNTNDVTEKKLYHSPASDVTEGDYYYNDIDNEIYLIKTVERNLEFPYANAVLCNQELTCKLWDKPIPCHIYNNSYGSKGEVYNISQISDMDSRANIEVQINDNTKMLYEGFRQIFNNDIGNRDVYEITKVQSVYGRNKFNNGGYFDDVCKYTKAVQEDDFKNGVAFNSKIDNGGVDVPEISIKGKDEIYVNQDETYTLENYNGNVIFKFDSEYTDVGTFDIISQTNTECVVEGLVKGSIGVLECRNKDDNTLLCTKTIYVRSR